MFCLSEKAIEEIRGRFKSGEITPEKLAEMDSAQRRGYFAQFLGEPTATKVNELFESKLLLKNQQKGIIDWAKQVSGLKPAQVRDIISRVNKMDKILTPENEVEFLADLASHRIGATVTAEEAANIFELAQNAKKAKEEISSGGDRVKYGRAKVAFDDYVNDLKAETKKKSLLEYLKPQNYLEGASNMAGLAKSLKASLDNSVIGRQGLKVAFTNPDIWLKNSIKSFSDIVHSFGGREVIDEVRADVLSRENAVNGNYKKEGLAVGVREEAYPSSLPQKVPILGRFFKASEAAFTAFQYRTRADIFDRYYETITNAGGDTTGIGILANSLTGRGKLGSLEPVADKLNNLFFSPRLLKSNIDALTAHAFDHGKMGTEAKKIAAFNTLKIVAGVATVLAIAKAVDPESVEEDPRSSDFGKIRVGDTRFDVSGGMAAISTLAARIVPALWGDAKTKSSVTDLLTELNSGKYGSKTTKDVLIDFGENKLSPMASFLLHIAEGRDREGKKTNLGKEAVELITPLPISNFAELRDNPNSANILAALIADGLGVSTNTFSAKTDWSESEGKELTQFKEQVGEEEFKKANEEFNTRFNDRLRQLAKSKEYQELDDELKIDLIKKEKIDIKKDIFRDYNFHYKKDKKEPLPEI